MPIFKAVYKKMSKLWYPQAVTIGSPVSMDELCKQIAMMTTVSTPDAKAAIEAMGMVMGGFMNSGRSVQVDGLGTFYYTCTSKGQGVSTADEVSAKQIAGTRVRFVPESSRKGNTIKRTLISEDLVWTNIKEISTLDGTGVTSSFTGITCGATGQTNGHLKRGAIAFANGNGIECKDATGEGFGKGYLRNEFEVDEELEIRLSTNDSLVFVVPIDLAEGNYTLRIETYMGENGKLQTEPRTIEYPTPLVLE